MTWTQRSARLARWVLACFALALGVAAAAPLLQPLPTQIVCGADGHLRLVVIATDQERPPPLQCALCLISSGAAPGPAVKPPALSAPGAAPLAMDPAITPACCFESRAPLPARGPPLSV